MGYVAQKSRWRAGTIDNAGQFRIVDLFHNRIVAGEQFDMSAEDVIDWCGNID